MSNPRLLFLVSQPRAGSTMTQKILAKHSQVHTQAEPWILLHHLQALKPENIIAGYNHKLTTRGVREFARQLPGGIAEYRKCTADYIGSLYASIVAGSGKTVFLDKTPRYYLILDEIMEYFPYAKIVILLRNPLAVLNSVVSTWSRGKLYTLYRFRQDLLEAPLVFSRFRTRAQAGVEFLRFEELVADPIPTLQELLPRIGLEYEQGLDEYGTSERFLFGDPKTVDLVSKPEAGIAEGWVRDIGDPQVWRLLYDYLGLLGEEVIGNLGYDHLSLLSILERARPAVSTLKHTIPLETLLDAQRDPVVGIGGLKKELERAKSDLENVVTSPGYLIGKTISAPFRVFRRFRPRQKKRGGAR